MQYEVLRDIKDAEDRVYKSKADAQAAAKNMIAEAERKGLTAVSGAVARAEEETARLLDEAERQAERQAADLREATSKEQAEIRRRAVSQMDAAAAIIVERIVNS